MKNKVILRFVIPPIIIISFIVVIIFSLSTKNSSPPSQSGWVLQTNLSTYLNGRTVNDMTFLDSLTGFAVTSNKFSGDTGYIFKTTNGGDNWFVNFMPFKSFSRIKFVNDSIGFACGGSGGGTAYFCKTTDRGNSWTGFNHGASFYEGMSVLNKDTIYLCESDGLTGGIFRSVNGGLNFTNINSWRATNIYMYNSMIGFISSFYGLSKTTNGGFNWFSVDSGGFNQMYFLDSLTGYRAYNGMKITTNGGYNWVNQYLPSVPTVTTGKGISKFQFIGLDTIWAIGGYVWYPNPGRYRGLLFKSTNGGNNWGYQLPDTHNIQINSYQLISFFSNKYGWINNVGGMGIHTVVGGDTTIFASIKNDLINNPNDYVLFQNYPNPFNSVSNIKYKIEKNANIKLIVFDIRGKEITTLINKKQNVGEYQVKFDASKLSSGIYFYSLFIEEIRIDTKKMIIIK